MGKGRAAPCLFVAVVLLSLAVLLSGCDWTLSRYGPGRTGANPTEHVINTANVATLTKRWSQPIPNKNSAGVAAVVAAGGALYAASSGERVVALDAATGSGKWSRSHVGAAWVAFGAGSVFTNSEDGENVVALNPADGSTRFSVVSHLPYFEPAIADGVVYITDQGDPAQLRAFDATTGAIRWTRSSAGGGLVGRPVVDQGVVFVNGHDGQVHAFAAASGHPLWTAPGAGSDLAAADGALYVTGGTKLMALNANDGSSRWTRTVPTVQSMPAVADGRVLLSTTVDVEAFDVTTGAQAWTAPLAPWGSSSPSVANHVVYTTSDGCRVHALDLSNGADLWQSSECEGWTLAIANGVLYATGGSTVDAFSLPSASALLVVSPAIPADFATLRIGTTSPIEWFAVSNQGMTASSAISTALVGPGSSQFLVWDTCSGVSLAPGAECWLGVTFTPAIAGVSHVGLESTAGNGGRVSALLTGTGFPFTVGPPTLDFGSIMVGTSSAAKTVLVTNTAGTPVSPVIALSGTGFTSASDHCTGTTLAPAGSCTIGVAYAPTADENGTGQLQVGLAALDDPYAAGLVTVGLRGVAVPALSISGRTDFGSVSRGTSKSLSYVVTNIGPGSSGELSAQLFEWYDVGFAMSGDTCTGSDLAAGEQCTVVVTFLAREQGAVQVPLIAYSSNAGAVALWLTAAAV